MDIVIVGKTEENTGVIAEEITSSIGRANVYTFKDGLFALQYLYSHHTDMVFAESAIRHVRIKEFVEFIRKFQPDTDVTIIDVETSNEQEFNTAEKYIVTLGADRLLKTPIKKEVLSEIVKNIQSSLYR